MVVSSYGIRRNRKQPVLISFIDVKRDGDRTDRLAVLDVRDSAILLDVDVESVGFKVLGHHHAWLDYATFLWQILLAEILRGA